MSYKTNALHATDILIQFVLYSFIHSDPLQA